MVRAAIMRRSKAASPSNPKFRLGVGWVLHALLSHNLGCFLLTEAHVSPNVSPKFWQYLCTERGNSVTKIIFSVLVWRTLGGDSKRTMSYQTLFRGRSTVRHGRWYASKERSNLSTNFPGFFNEVARGISTSPEANVDLKKCQALAFSFWHEEKTRQINFPSQLSKPSLQFCEAGVWCTCWHQLVLLILLSFSASIPVLQSNQGKARKYITLKG